jgi:hypothetical protein
MADSRPTPASPWRAFSLCVTAIVAPERMEAEESKDNEIRRAMAEALPNQNRGAFIVRRAFVGSFVLVVLSGLVGYIAGVGMHSLGRCATSATVAWLQITGASLLLWGTLFIRGWEIQSYGGVTLTERVNQWIYRALYCIGTAVAVYSLAFATCKQ